MGLADPRVRSQQNCLDYCDPVKTLLVPKGFGAAEKNSSFVSLSSTGSHSWFHSMPGYL
jgi:hypothetical protein